VQVRRIVALGELCPDALASAEHHEGDENNKPLHDSAIAEICRP
jgi:hypothetical protein